MTPTLTTERLSLGPCAEAHLDAFTAFVATEASRFLGGPSEDPTDAWWSCAAHAGQWTLRGYGTFWLTDRVTGAPVGRVGPWHPGWAAEPDMSWVVYPAFEGRGLAHEAARAVLDWAARERGLTALASFVNPDNARSLALARRLGAREERRSVSRDGETAIVFRHGRAEAA
ncbi:N-acetyltransferase [Rhodobacteraceae bacterium CCMM004]|nr:N-acetyltransferase [Rhodobacteraceae bacterium CCMM004]